MVSIYIFNLSSSLILFPQKNTMTKISQISPGGGLSEGLRGTHGELRELSEGLSEGLRGTQGRTQGLRGLRPPILENSGGNSGGTSPRSIAKLTMHAPVFSSDKNVPSLNL